MTDIREQVIAVLEAEVEERQKIISVLKGMGAGKNHKEVAPSRRGRPWTQAQRKSFMATMRKKKAAKS